MKRLWGKTHKNSRKPLRGKKKPNPFDITYWKCNTISMKKSLFLFLLGILTMLFLSTCSINKMVMGYAADALSSGSSGSVFTSDNDPELVGDAIPFALKMYETLLDSNPEHVGLLTTTGSGFVMYANAFVQGPADMLPDSRYQEKKRMRERAKKLYLRGRKYLFRALEVKQPNFLELVKEENYGEAFEPFTEEDVSLLYWTGASWLAAISVDIFDITLAVEITKAGAIMKKALELDPDYGNGAIHDFFILYYASVPEGLGGSIEKARYHFKRAVEISEGVNPSPYVSLATTVCIKKQLRDEFVMLLEKSLAIDVNEHPENRLAAIISQRKASWYLEHLEDFFLPPLDEAEMDEEFFDEEFMDEDYEEDEYMEEDSFNEEGESDEEGF